MEYGSRIEGNLIRLTEDEVCLFGADDSLTYVARVDTATTMDSLATQRRAIDTLGATASSFSWLVGPEQRSFSQRLELFMPAAGAILAYETEEWVNSRQDEETRLANEVEAWLRAQRNL